MKLTRWLVPTLWLLPVLASAHPGHDGPHDLEWDPDHFVRHPVATVMCLAVLAAGVWTVWLLIQSLRAKGDPAAVRIKSRR